MLRPTRTTFAVFACVLVLTGCSPSQVGGDEGGESPAGDETAAVSPKTEDEKTLYALGMAMAENLGVFDLSEEEMRFVLTGLEDAVLDREAAVDLAEYGPKIQAMAERRRQAIGEEERSASVAFLDEQRAAEGVEITESGIIVRSREEGTGPSPGATDTVTVHYRGTLRDGTVFDSSYDRGEPATFPLDRVIPCWTEMVQTMKVGGSIEIVCPPDVAYGARGGGAKIPPNAALVFEIELLGIGGQG